MQDVTDIKLAGKDKVLFKLIKEVINNEKRLSYNNKLIECLNDDLDNCLNEELENRLNYHKLNAIICYNKIRVFKL